MTREQIIEECIEVGFNTMEFDGNIKEAIIQEFDDNDYKYTQNDIDEVFNGIAKKKEEVQFKAGVVIPISSYERGRINRCFID